MSLPSPKKPRNGPASSSELDSAQGPEVSFGVLGSVDDTYDAVEDPEYPDPLDQPTLSADRQGSDLDQGANSLHASNAPHEDTDQDSSQSLHGTCLERGHYIAMSLR